MNRPRTFTLAPAAQDADGIAESQQPAAGGVQDLTLNGALVSGGIATMDMARRVAITSDGDDSGRTFTLTGTDRYGRPITEEVTGPNTATVYSVQDFLTVSQVAVDDDTAGNITVGTGGMVSGPWIPVDRKKAANLGFGVTPSGTVNYTVEHTFDDVFQGGVGVQPPGGVPAQVFTTHPHPTIASKSDAESGWYTGQPVTAVRVTINTYSDGASVKVAFAPGFIEGPN